MTDHETNQASMYTSYRWVMLVVMSMAIIAVFIDQIAFAPILGEVAKGLNVDMGTATNLMMGWVLATGFVLLWGGIVCDKYGVTVALVLGLLLATIPATLMPWIGDSYGKVMVVRLLGGASVGFIFAVIGPILALWFPPKEQGIAGGIIIACISLGCAIGGVVSPMVLSAGFSWQATVSLLSLLGWVTMILSLALTRRQPSAEVVRTIVQAMQASVGQLSFVKALALPVTWVGSVITFFNSWSLYGVLNLIPPFIAAPAPMGVGLGSVSAGKFALVSTIVGIISTIIGGTFFDRISKGKAKPAIIIGFVLTGLFAFPLAYESVYSSMALLVVCLILVGWGVNFMSASLSGYIAMNYPPNIVGSMVGWWFGFSCFGGAAGLYIGGRTIACTGSFKLAIIAMSFAAAAGFIATLFLKQRR